MYEHLKIFWTEIEFHLSVQCEIDIVIMVNASRVPSVGALHSSSEVEFRMPDMPGPSHSQVSIPVDNVESAQLNVNIVVVIVLS